MTYKKISNLNKTNIQTVDNTNLNLKCMSTSLSAINIIEDLGNVKYHPKCHADSINLTMRPDITASEVKVKVKANYNLNNISFYSETNKYQPVIVNPEIINDEATIPADIDSFIQRINYVSITPTLIENDQVITSENIINSLTIEDNNIYSVEFNLPSLKTLKIINMSRMKNLRYNDFDDIEHIEIQNLYNQPFMRFSKLATNAIFRIHCLVEYLVIEGSNTHFDTNNFFIFAEWTNKIKFINCTVSDNLKTILESYNIELIFE